MGWWEDEQMAALIKEAPRALTPKEARKLLAKYGWDVAKATESLAGPRTTAETADQAAEAKPSVSASHGPLLFGLRRWTAFRLALTVALQFIAVYFEWGLVFFILATLYWIVQSMERGTRKPGQLSAYSLFNPNLEALPGSYEESLKGFFGYFNFHNQLDRPNPRDRNPFQ